SLAYEVRYRGGASFTGGTEITDETRPNPPVVTLPELPTRTTWERGSRELEAWVPEFASIRVAWRATDPESGIRRYVYGVGLSPDTADVFEWVDVGGRRSAAVNLRAYDIPPDTTVYVHAAAQNGAGMWTYHFGPGG
ncbi:MAG: hypothetical protein GWM92_02520, partial [Gemmatimonadetes bacterium]|nr:hypothetical protein [Gemmatimonadota bacterium]NIR80090.1 hypothetical protein [Gemmatimonadota bacterium]NIT85888.1 hypothetical protein [Gemmatimonadota bacterium]NIU33773.1 hypothetical protein [Gemmatimonadota bacterium]NIU37085.1 hypothetical protein [Gemmatimonadota bacterium]